MFLSALQSTLGPFEPLQSFQDRWMPRKDFESRTKPLEGLHMIRVGNGRAAEGNTKAETSSEVSENERIVWVQHDSNRPTKSKEDIRWVHK